MLIVKNGITKDVSEDTFLAKFKGLGFKPVDGKKKKKKNHQVEDEMLEETIEEDEEITPADADDEI